MNKKLLCAGWACLYVLCVALGYVSEPQGFGKVLLVLTALIFFLPGAMLLYSGIRDKDRKTLLRLRIVSAVSLSLTFIFLVVNMFSVLMSEAAGKVVHTLLALVSAPMLCGQYWVLSLFLWACMLMATFVKLPDKH